MSRRWPFLLRWLEPHRIEDLLAAIAEGHHRGDMKVTGFRLREHYRVLTGRDISYGWLYVKLREMEERGLIEHEEFTDEFGRRRSYRLTDAGTAKFVEQTKEGS